MTGLLQGLNRVTTGIGQSYYRDYTGIIQGYYRDGAIKNPGSLRTAGADYDRIHNNIVSPLVGLFTFKKSIDCADISLVVGG